MKCIVFSHASWPDFLRIKTTWNLKSIRGPLAVNTLWPTAVLWCHVIWHHRSGSTLAQVIHNGFLPDSTKWWWNLYFYNYYHISRGPMSYCQTSDIRRTWVGNKIVDHSDVVGASPVGAAPTTSSWSTWHLASMGWPKATARREDNHLSFWIWCV